MSSRARAVSSALMLGLVLGSTSGAAQVPTCEVSNPVTTINTLAKGQSPTKNAIVSTDVTGHIIGAAGLGPNASRIRVCAGTNVMTATTDTSGAATVTKTSPGVICGAGPDCTINAIGATQKYTVQSSNGADTDSLAFVPE